MEGQQDVVRPDRTDATPDAAGEQSDSRLVARAVKAAQAGDRDALAFLYVRYADDIYRYVLRIVDEHHLAEDVTQHVFAKLIRVIDKYEERGLPFLTWMLRVAHNAALDAIRTRHPIPVAEVRLQTGMERELGRERARDLRESLEALPSAQREVLVLRHLAGLSPGEIALRTGRTESSVHGLHHRGRLELTAELTSRGAAPVTARSSPSPRTPTA